MATWKVVLLVDSSGISDPQAWVHDTHQCKECGELMLPDSIVTELRKLNRFLLPCKCGEDSIHDDVDYDEGAWFMVNRKIPYLKNPAAIEAKKLGDINA